MMTFNKNLRPHFAVLMMLSEATGWASHNKRR